MLSCVRLVKGSGYCEEFTYFAYETAAGEIISTPGSTFKAWPGNGFLGRCENNRRNFLELPLAE